MTSKLTWATAIILIVAVAGVGAWAILGGAPVSETGTITVSSGVVFGAPPENSGIENIYIMTGSYNLSDNLSGTAFRTITGSGVGVSVPAGTTFDIVIAYTAHGDNLYALKTDNAKIQWEVSGEYIIGAGTELTNETIFENTVPEGTVVIDTDNYMRVNVLAANDWTLNAGQSISLDNVSLWIFGQ